MKKITQNSIINIDENLFDNKFLFDIPVNPVWKNEIDLSLRLKEFKNENLEYKKDYKLWSEVYSPKDELRIFEELIEDTLSSNSKVHISNISLAEEVDIVRDLYLKLWYYNPELNSYEIDFINAPVTIWVNVRNIIYSFKDYKSLKDKMLFLPPPREPRHQKAIKAAINSWIISMLNLNDIHNESFYLEDMLKQESINLIKLWKILYFNFKKRGFDFALNEIILNLK